MAGMQVGMGLSGIMMNVISGLIILVDDQGENSSTFKDALIFYIIAAVLLLLISMLYFVEVNNSFARHWTALLEE